MSGRVKFCDACKIDFSTLFRVQYKTKKNGEPIPVNQFSDLVTQTYKSPNLLSSIFQLFLEPNMRILS